MTAEIILTDEQIRQAVQCLTAEMSLDGETLHLKNVNGCIRAIEQAVLQSPEIQAMREDALRYRWLRLQRTIADHACVTWNIGHDWVQMDGAELDAAIDHARRAEGGGE